MHILLAIMVFLTPATIPLNWINIASKVEPATFLLTDPQGQGFCTGFVIDAKRDFALTAAHCVASDYAGYGVFVDGQEAEIVYVNSAIDTAVLKLAASDRPALKREKKLLEAGQPVASAGYGFGISGIMFRAGEVSNPSRYYPNEFRVPDGPWVELNYSVIGGMSGGPVVNSKGKIVSMTQMGFRDQDVSFGRSIIWIYEHTRQYWPE